MTAVNNDVIAIAAFSWFLWGSVRLIKRGLTYSRFHLDRLCGHRLLFIQKHGYSSPLPLVFVVLLFAVLRGR